MKFKGILFVLFLVSITFLAACSNKKTEEKPLETEELASALSFEDGVYAIDVDASTLYWEAFAVTGGHMGGISLEKGEIFVKDAQPSQGSFTIDMNSITNTDIENEGMRMNLINHLKSDDFFSVADYPKARIDITRILSYEEGDDYDYRVEADLSLKGKTDGIVILAKVEQGEGQINIHGFTEVDRTKFGINFRSGSFFENLGDKLIKDEFTLEMDLVAKMK